jgi:RimJ/RimL family protein N-acetyltransferase
LEKEQFLEAPVIFTPRLKISQLIADDAEALFQYRSDPTVCRYQSFEPSSLDDAKALINDLQSNSFDVPGSWFQFGIRLRETGLLIGDLGVHFMDYDSRQVEIGFTLAPDYQGRGYGTEAVSALIDYLLGPLHKHRVFASVDPRNKASIALMNRIGMRQEAHFRESLWFKGEWADDLVFAVLKSEWKESD